MSLSEYSCKICSSEVKDTDPAVLCDLCEKWIDTDCASIERIPVRKPKRKYFTMVLSLLHHGTSFL